MRKILFCPAENCQTEPPAIQTSGSVGLDLRANESVILETGDAKTIGTGWIASIPPGCGGLILPRSGLGRKGLRIGNTVGLIDPDYRGEIMLSLEWHPLDGRPIAIGKGDRVAQMIVVPCLTESLVVDRLGETARGDGGFGSTGT